MYCPVCGSEVGEGLRYCNRCGGNLTVETSAPPRLYGIILTLALATLLIGVTGLAALFFFAIEFLGRGDIPAGVVLFLIIFTLVFFGIEALLIRQLSRSINVYLQTAGASAPENRGINKSKSQTRLTEARQAFVQTDSPHTTASDEAEMTTRILPDEATTRKLENRK